MSTQENSQAPETAPKTAKKSTKKATTAKKAQTMTDTAATTEVTAATAVPTTYLESGIVTEPTDLQYIKVDPANVRNWDNYRLSVVEKTVDAPGEEFQRIVKEIEISGENDSRILELWNSLYTYNEETGTGAFIVTTPLVLIANSDGTKTPVSGNTRAFLAQQLVELQQAGQIDWPITYKVPYVITEGLSVTDKILSQISSNNGVPLSLWEQFDVISLVAEGSVEKYRSVAKSVYPPKGGLAFRLAQLFDLSLQDYPVESVRPFIPSLDTALKLFKAYEKLASTYPTLTEVYPLSDIVVDVEGIASNGKFSDKDLLAIEVQWKQRLHYSGIEVEGFKAAKPESEESTPAEPKEYPLVEDSWDQFEEAYSVAVAALNQGALKDTAEDVNQELARLAHSLNKTLKKFNSLLFPKESAKASVEPTEAPVTDKPAKTPKASKKKVKEPTAAANEPQPLPAETMAALEANFQAMEGTAPTETPVANTLTPQELENVGLPSDLPE